MGLPEPEAEPLRAVVGGPGSARAWLSLRWEEARWAEASGALGDLGTFLPLLVGLSQEVGLDVGATLLATGMYNLVTGATFGVPMPVQPMKSIAAVALTEGSLTLEQVLAAGFSVSAIVFALGATGLIDAFNTLVPAALISGIQLGLGLSLANKGLTYALRDGNDGPYRDWLGVEGLLVGLAAAAFVAVTAAPHNQDGGRPRRTPTALVVVVVGLVMAAAADRDAVRALRLGPSAVRVVLPSMRDFRVGFVRAAVPQLPLTTLNSVVSVTALSNDLFPSKPVTCRAVATSVGAMNLVGCWLGVMPCCHGAGGLAAQYRFGARTGTAVLLLGAAKVAIGLVFGASVESLLDAFPQPLLGVLLLMSALELASACRKEGEPEGAFVMLLTAASTLFTKSTWWGFVAGASVHALLRLSDAAGRLARAHATARASSAGPPGAAIV